MHHHIGVFSGGAIVVGAFFLTLSSGEALGHEWLTEEVDTVANGPWSLRLVLDDFGTPHISHACFGDGDGNPEYIRYAVRGSTRWAAETVCGVGESTSRSIRGHSMALDSAGSPHITSSYYPGGSDHGDRDLLYAHKVGSSWAVDIVDADGKVGLRSAIAMDSLDHPHIAYYDYSNGHLKYAVHTGQNWDLSVIDSDSYTGVWCDLELDSLDTPHIGYVRGLGGVGYRLRYAAWDTSAQAWAIEEVDAPPYNTDQYAGWYPSIAVDSADRPSIAYQYQDVSGQPWDEDIRFARQEGGSWSIETVASSPGTSNEETCLAFDSNDYPHIVYQRSTATEGYLVYTWWDGSTWQSEDLLTDGWPWTVAMDLDDEGHPHIAYSVPSSDTVYYTTVVPEPSSGVILGLGSLFLARFWRTRRFRGKGRN